MSDTEEMTSSDGEGAAKQEIKREISEFIKMILWFLILFFVIKGYVIEGYEVQGPSMIPTLEDRERILVLKLPHKLSQWSLLSGINAVKQSDIVVFDSPVEPDKRYVKRVIAKGPKRLRAKTVDAGEVEASATSIGPTVGVRFDHGAVYVNNRRIAEDYLTERAKGSDDSFAEVPVPPGGYYVLGDNRGVSKDSRSFGAIDDEHVVGRALLCFWPPAKIRLLR